MSWNSYIDNLISQSKDSGGRCHVDKACIIGLNGGVKWTTDGHEKAFKITPGEGADIALCFKGKDFTPFQTNGVPCEGQNYQFLRQENQKVVMAKKKEHGAVTLRSSKTAIVIAHTPEGGQQGCSKKAVAVIADYLEGMNM
ncbi:profilin-like [Anneissia japonica]|uniref:profilin-like n=1 Tax=Anneissia japonica TaxID=1529436 RepID=UPI001425951A|nr:profilin-like [Anneissia japonica]